MTSLHKLGITGIRSFGPDDEEIIRFLRPVTIILGDNGVGKTTIIECVKMAVTGDLPPLVGRGAAFLHDPKVAHATETRAKIRMSFSDGGGNEILVDRQFKVTSKGGKGNQLEYKNTDSTVKVVGKDSNATSKNSNKCINVNQVVTERMGVSKAILENVIFVHQEESQWPLGDGKKLKEKFDDIFASTRYTKALDFIRKYRRDQQIRQRELNAELGRWKEKIDWTRNIRMEYDLALEEEKKIDARRETVDRNLVRINQDLDTLRAKVRTLEESRREMDNAMAQKEEKLKYKMDIAKELNPPLEQASDEELFQWVNDSEGEVKKILEQRTNLQSELRATEDEISALSISIVELTNEKGRLEASEQVHNRNKLRLLQLKEQVLESEHLRHLPSRPDPQEGKNKWVPFLSSVHQSVQHKLQQTLNSSKERAEAAVRDVNEARIKLRTHQANIEGAKSEGREKRRLASEKASSVRSILSSELIQSGMMQALDRQRRIVESVNLSHERRSQELDLHSQQQHYDKLRSELSEVRNETATLREEKALLLLQKQIFERVDAEKRFLMEKDAELVLLSQELVERVCLLQPGQSSNGDMLDEAAKIVSSLEVNFETVRKEEQAAKTDLAASEALLSSKEKQLRCRKDTLRTLEDTIRVHYPELSKHQFEKDLEVAEERAQARSVEKAGLEGVVDYLRSLERKAQRKKSCPTCQRGLGSELSVEDFSKRVGDQIMKLQRAIEAGERNDQDLSIPLEALKKLTPVWEAMEAAIEDVQQLTLETEKLRDELGRGGSRLGSILETLQEADERRAEGQVLSGLMNKIREVEHEIEKHKQILTTEESKILASPSALTLSVAEQQLADYEVKADRVSGEMERVQKIRDMGMRELSVLEKQVSIEREKMIQMEQLADRVRLLEEEITGLKNDADALDAKVADGEEQLCQLEQDVRVVTEEREKVMLNLESCTEEIRSKEQQISRAKEDMVRAFQEVESYEMSGRQSDLLRLIERGTQLEGKVQELRVIRKDVDSHFQATNKTLAEQESRKRNILDNIKFRKLTSEIDSLALEIEAYNRKANEVSGGTDLIKSLSTIEKQLMEANAIKSSLVGSRHIVSRTRQEKERELRERDEDGLRKDYNALLVEKKTLELSVSELERYQRALDQALMAYHAIKMHDINKILRELWATTYRGNDIDTIEIVSDVETAESSNVRRSYNYRVVMHRGDAILDMRGRCSAGQKVLACLVIRLALAESFCLDCGILALDEPTTNLDALNIESLAASLAEIIRHRRQQRNFQLLVITHDERFIELLGARDVVDDYYLVKKDDRGLSRIFKQSLRKL